jgi:hypothetical protein
MNKKGILAGLVRIGFALPMLFCCYWKILVYLFENAGKEFNIGISSFDHMIQCMKKVDPYEAAVMPKPMIEGDTCGLGFIWLQLPLQHSQQYLMH